MGHRISFRFSFLIVFQGKYGGAWLLWRQQWLESFWWVLDQILPGGHVVWVFQTSKDDVLGPKTCGQVPSPLWGPANC